MALALHERPPLLILELAILFAAGIVQDALNASYVRSCAERARWRATVLSGVVTVFGCLVFARLLATEQVHEAGAQLFAYALGSSVGTWVGLRPVA
jgi:hypothetical protein